MIIGTLNQFQTWLEARRDKRVGYSKRTCSCPLAYWLRSLNKGILVNVGGAGHAFDPKDVSGAMVDLPVWAIDFVETVDTVLEDSPNRVVYGYQALVCLENHE